MPFGANDTKGKFAGPGNRTVLFSRIMSSFKSLFLCADYIHYFLNCWLACLPKTNRQE